MNDRKDEGQPEHRRDRTEDSLNVVVPKEPQEIEVKLVGVREGILDRDGLEERELVADRVHRVERDRRDLAGAGAKQVA